MSLQKNISRADRFCPPLLNSSDFDEHVHIDLKLKASLEMLKWNHPFIFWMKNPMKK